MTQYTSDNAILTSVGDYLDILDPQPEHYKIEMIAASLSKQCRFVGQCKFLYTVAQHCLLVVDILENQLKAPEIALEGLLHEGAESVLGDVNTMLKRLLPEYKRIEHLHEEVIAWEFDLDMSDSTRAMVKRGDLIALRYERECLLPATVTQWKYLRDVPAYTGTFQIREAVPARDEMYFLNCYKSLVIARRTS
jgi:hypothetical protein